MSARLLVVDDEPFNLEIIAEFLDGCGYQLKCVESGNEALTLLRRPDQHFDAALIDRMMPGMSGVELLRALRQDRRFDTLPIIMQTAAGTREAVREGLQAGAFYYLVKPFEAESLRAIVHAALEDRARRIELAERIESQDRALALLSEASYRLRTLEDARALAANLASLSDAPELLALGLAELLINAIEHGNLGIAFDEKSRLKQEDRWEDEVARRLALPQNQDKRVSLTLRRVERGYEFEIGDEGAGFDWRSFQELDPERAFAPNGRGILLARQLAFVELEYLGSGNRVRALSPLPTVRELWT